jgi:hypothetical protein
MSRSKTARERDALRTARRDAANILLSRAQRGVLSKPDADQLRAIVEAEFALADQTRASAGGQQIALQREQRRAEAAEHAIREAEQERDEAAQLSHQYRNERDKARALHDDYARRLDRVQTLAAIIRSEAHPFGLHAHFANRIEQALAGDQCVCGEPEAAGTTHRTDGPCHITEQAPTVPSLPGQRITAADMAAASVAASVAQRATITFADPVQQQLADAEKRTQLAHQARRDKEAQLDDIKRAMLDAGLMDEGDPYSHADLADVIRQSADRRAKYEHIAEEQQQRAADLEQQLADLRKAYADMDAVATLRASRLDEPEQHRQALANMLGCAAAASWPLLLGMVQSVIRGRATAETEAWDYAATADRYETAWRSARKRARNERSLRETWQKAARRYRGQTADLRQTIIKGRELLRATEDQLAEARRRNAERPPTLSPGTCNGAGPAGRGHPVHALKAALTDGRALTSWEAADLITPYFRYLHDKFCTREHPETP